MKVVWGPEEEEEIPLRSRGLLMGEVRFCGWWKTVSEDSSVPGNVGSSGGDLYLPPCRHSLRPRRVECRTREPRNGVRPRPLGLCTRNEFPVFDFQVSSKDE